MEAANTSRSEACWTRSYSACLLISAKKETAYADHVETHGRLPLLDNGILRLSASDAEVGMLWFAQFTYSFELRLCLECTSTMTIRAS